MSCSNKDCVFSYKSTGQFTAGSCNCLADLKISTLELMVLRKFLANGKKAVILLQEGARALHQDVLDMIPEADRWPVDQWILEVDKLLNKVQ